MLVETEVVRYKSFDGLDIPAILFKPKGASAENPVPAVVDVHGGPGGQNRKGYSAMYQHLANHGYAVLRVNNRGSSGYGKTFFHMDDKKHGEVDLDDVVYGKKYLQTLDWVQDDKIAILGGSYGGYMVAAASPSAQKNSTPASTSSASPTGRARCRKSPHGGAPRNRRSLTRWATRPPTPNATRVSRRCSTPPTS
jgi:dipeptidyl aminopeptidase/acylaminoacyl peptidase